MGFPLRSNIFKSGTDEQKYFSRFPIQVAVIFSPKDQGFKDAFRNIFFELDKLTGDDVAFFAVLDPPLDWLTEAGDRSWWRQYRSRIGQMSFSMDDSVLLKEIARLFSIGWGELPQIVVSTNLWTGETVNSPTSSLDIQRQLEILTNLVRELGEPNIGHIDERLSDAFGVETHYHPPDDTLRYRFSRVYGILDTVESPDNIELYSRFAEEEFRQSQNILRQSRLRENDRRQIRERDIDEILTDSAMEDMIEDAAGRLVAPATVAMRMFRQFHHGRALEIADKLEEESLVMVETALTIGNFLENIQNNALGGIFPLRLGTRGRGNARWQPSEIDFTPGAQAAWKAFELEINLSLIQAARASISIRMPEFFARYDSEFPDKQSSKILIGSRNGREIYRDINQLDWEAKQTRRHRFLSIGDAHAVALNLAASSNYENVISMCLGHSLPSDLFNAWQSIRKIRNKGSHIEPLRHQDYSTLLETVLSPDTLDPLIKIKSKLSSRDYAPPPVISDDMRKAEGYKREIEALRTADVANQIHGYYQNWQQIQSQEARLLLAKAIVEKVRNAGREKATAERAWYKELWKFLDEA
jgi:hypothetical protein